MPLYEYHCEDCRHEVEVLVRGCDPAPECPLCGSPKLQKLLSVVAAPASGGRPESGSASGGPPAGGSCGAGCGCHPRG